MLDLAYQKMAETRQNRMIIGDQAVYDIHSSHKKLKQGEGNAKRERVSYLNRLKAEFLLKVKSITKPKAQIAASSPYAPLTTSIA